MARRDWSDNDRNYINAHLDAIDEHVQRIAARAADNYWVEALQEAADQAREEVNEGEYE